MSKTLLKQRPMQQSVSLEGIGKDVLVPYTLPERTSISIITPNSVQRDEPTIKAFQIFEAGIVRSVLGSMELDMSNFGLSLEPKATLIPNNLKPEFLGITMLLIASIFGAIYGGLMYGINSVLVALAPILAGVTGLVTILSLVRRTNTD